MDASHTGDTHTGDNETRGEFNNASARRALVDWYLSLFIMCKAWHQYNERPRALALLNLPPETQNWKRQYQVIHHLPGALLSSNIESVPK